MQTDRRYHAIKLQPSMKVSQQSTQITLQEDPDFRKRQQRMLSKGLGPPRKRFRLTNTDKSAYCSFPEGSPDSGMKTVLFKYKDGKLLYTAVDMHRAGFSPLGGPVVDQSEEYLEQRGKEEDIDDFATHRSKSKTGMGFIDDEVGIDYDENFDDDEDNVLVVDIERDGFEDDDLETKKNQQNEGELIHKLLKKAEEEGDLSESEESDNFEDLEDISADDSEEEEEEEEKVSRKREASSMSMPDPSVFKRPKVDDKVPVDQAVTEQDIRDIFARHVRLTIPTLTSKLRSKLKFASKEDKEAFRALVVRLCDVVTKDGDRFLVLKKII